MLKTEDVTTMSSEFAEQSGLVVVSVNYPVLVQDVTATILAVIVIVNTPGCLVSEVNQDTFLVDSSKEMNDVSTPRVPLTTDIEYVISLSKHVIESSVKVGTVYEPVDCTC